MARLLRASRNAIRSCSARSPTLSLLRRNFASTSSDLSAAEETLPRSPLDANIVRILRNDIDYQSQYAPPHEHVTEYKSFTVQDRPGEQWITMRRKFGDNEDVKIEATMFDGYALTPKLADDSVGDDLSLHISLLVDISKGNDSESLEFVGSAWPEGLEVQSVYLLR